MTEDIIIIEEINSPIINLFLTEFSQFCEETIVELIPHQRDGNHFMRINYEFIMV